MHGYKLYKEIFYAEKQTLLQLMKESGPDGSTGEMDQ